MRATILEFQLLHVIQDHYHYSMIHYIQFQFQFLLHYCHQPGDHEVYYLSVSIVDYVFPNYLVKYLDLFEKYEHVPSQSASYLDLFYCP